MVVESIFRHSPDEGFWACLGDLLSGMPRRPETRFFPSKTYVVINAVIMVISVHGLNLLKKSSHRVSSVEVDPMLF